MMNAIFCFIMEWVVYILFSKELNRYYTGCTSAIDERLKKHAEIFYGNRGFTAKASDWELCYQISCSGEWQAKCIEQHIKSMKSRVYIENLIRYPEITVRLLEKYKNC